MKRRHFLQFTASTLATLALSDGQRLHQAIAQTSGRKLALLVGINQYSGGINPLGGCLNDVRLQYELLVHRYGFNPQDIAIVADATLELPAKQPIAPPTRQVILDAFQSHLGQAQPGDAVVFHYSGHGTYVRDPHPIAYAQEADYPGEGSFENRNGNNGAIVPNDALVGTAPGEANVIMGSTIFLLCHALKTENVTLILDSCYSGGGVRGNLVYRSTLNEKEVFPSQAEKDFQDRLIADLGLTRDRLQEMRQAGIAKGIAMTSALATQLAAEGNIASFKSGLFTYLLTRYLWQTSTARPLNEAFTNLARIARAQADEIGGDQEPIYFAKPGTALDTQPPYLLNPATLAADAVIRDVKADGTLEYWLGGMTPHALERAESIFDLFDEEGKVVGQARLSQRNGLLGHGKLETEGVAVQPGMLARESIRGIPTDMTLRVGIHASLGEDADRARQLLAGFDRVEVLEVNGETETDYLLGRFDETAQAEIQQQNRGTDTDSPDIENGSIGLFANSLDPIPATFGSQYEELGLALERLSPRLRLLLANRALKTILNPETSELNVAVEVSSNQRGRIEVVESGSRRRANVQNSQFARMRIGEEMSLRVTNKENRSLYVAVIATERDGDMFVYHPSDWNVAEIDAELGAGESIVIPKDDDVFYLPIVGPTGYFDVLVIASTEQLRDTLLSLKRLSDRAIGRGQLIPFTDADEGSRSPQDSILSIVTTLLGDLDRDANVPYAMRPGQTNVNSSQLAAFAVTIEVSEG
jgi:Caspase domain/Domain of unknown function (DUF4384)